MPPSTLPASAYEGLGLPSNTVNILTKPQPAPKDAASPNVLQAEPLPAHGLALNESSITLYAELLLHIRTVTLFASLRTVHTRETKATLASDGYSITVTHEGESATIRLPIKATGGGDAALSLPAHPPSKELSLRLQIEEQEGSDLFTGVHAEERKANLVPWDGASLNERKDVNLLCKNCEAVVLPSGQIKEWRDLPNENWAEMMDFWHCHKPDEHHLHDHTHHTTVAKKGYAAGNRLKASEGVGFVDLASFLLKEQECSGVQLASDRQSSDNALICKNCTRIVGVADESSDGWRIWKWSIKWISARLLFLIENQGVRKFHIHPDASPASSDPTPSLLLWVFTPDLLFSSSIHSNDRRDPTRAMKVFYQKQTWSPPNPGDPESASEEEVPFPEELFGELEAALKRSQGLLPSGARRFQGWDVGLLERFDIQDLESFQIVQRSVSSQEKVDRAV